MRRLAALACVLALSPVSAFAFTDIGTSPHRADILALKDARVLQGYEDGTFKPKARVNRAELLKVAIPDGPDVVVPKRRCFPDVAVNAWYAKYVCEGKQRRIVKGYSSGHFEPGNEVNFAEAITILLRAERIAVDAGGSPWYASYVGFAHEKGIVSKNSYKPQDPLTRERLAQILQGIRRFKQNRDRPDGFLSAGCGKQIPATPPSSIDVNGIVRSFMLRVPKDYSPREPHKIIFAFHGRTNSNEQVRRYMNLDTFGPEFLIVYPAALKNGGSFSWKATQDGDYAFFDQLLAAFAEQYCVDMDEVYVVGHSLGAWFGNSLACARGDVIRGSYTLGGGTTFADCTGPVAAMVLHNPNDNLAAFETGIQARDQHLEQNACQGTDTVPAEPLDMLCVRYAGCPTADPVLWCPHEKNMSYWDNEYYPHQWPEDAGRQAVEFFRGLPQ